MLLDFAAAICRAALMMSGSKVSVVRIESRSFRHFRQEHHSITASTHQMCGGELHCNRFFCYFGPWLEVVTGVSSPVADGGVIKITRMPITDKFYKVERK
jgi:hypothetical protein